MLVSFRRMVIHDVEDHLEAALVFGSKTMYSKIIGSTSSNDGGRVEQFFPRSSQFAERSGVCE